MAKNATWSTALRDARNDAVAADFDDGYLRLYDGAQPAGPGTAITTQNQMAELRFGATAFGASASGVLTANAIASDSDAAGGGNPVAWFRCFASDGTTALHDGTVGTSNANCIVATTTIVPHTIVDVSAFTITDAAASAQ